MKVDDGSPEAAVEVASVSRPRSKSLAKSSVDVGSGVGGARLGDNARAPDDLLLAEVRHGGGRKAPKSFRISSGNRQVCTTFAIEFEPLGKADAELLEK